MTARRAKWFDAGNEAVGFVAIGNVATGVIAFGNLARGVIAVGNLAVGVVAVGNVGFGIIGGGGATVAVGFFAYAGCIAFPVHQGGAMAADLSSLGFLAVIPVIAWLAASFVWKGALESRAHGRRLVRATHLQSGRLSQGWIRGALDTFGGGKLSLRHRGRLLEVEANSRVDEQARGLPPTEGPVLVHALVEAVEAPAAGAGGYRQAPEMERALRCTDLQGVPPRAMPWQTSQELQYWLAWAWRVGAGLGAAFLVGRLVGWII